MSFAFNSIFNKILSSLMSLWIIGGSYEYINFKALAISSIISAFCLTFNFYFFKYYSKFPFSANSSIR